MCLAIPGKVKKVEGHKVLIEYPGQERMALVGDDVIKPGDYVMVQMGVVVNSISEEEAKVSLKAWEECR